MTVPSSMLSGKALRAFLEGHVLPYVRTPAQYLGGELNQIVKDHATAKVKVALAFPDTYSVGMSSIGLKILYHVWNEQRGTLCERVFAPWPDFEACLRQHGLPLYSLETFTPLREFDVVAFSVAYELGFSNILTMLDLGGIPLRSEQRDTSHPLVIMGGHAVFNPEPVADFMDIACMGEGEELAAELTAKLAELKPRQLSREELLYRLAREVRGLYVPRFYRVEHAQDGRITGVKPTRTHLPLPVARRVVRDFEHAPFPTKPLVPFVETVFERYAIEVMRGCVNGCRFCQAGMITRPQRQRSPERIMELARAGYEATGFDEIGLLSLSSSDYVGIADLAKRMNDFFEPLGVSLSFPSLRVGTVLATMPKELSRTRKAGLTIAPEAATQRMRMIINKPILDEHLLAACREAYTYGFDQVKLYFMLGLPGETDDDLRAIGDLAARISFARMDVRGRKAKVTVSVSNFVPKPGTPFQWAPMLSRDEWRRRQKIVRDSCRLGTIKCKFHNVEVSYLEGLFSRGDRRLGAVLESAWRKGARFDGWDDQLKLDAWQAAFLESHLDPDWFALRERALEETLPWVAVNDTVSPAFLKREWAKSREMGTTPGCADTEKDPCQICDACERSLQYEQKEAMLRAPVDGLERDSKYAERTWGLPASSTGMPSTSHETPSNTAAGTSPPGDVST